MMRNSLILLIVLGLLSSCRTGRSIPEVTYPEIEVTDQPEKVPAGGFHPFRPYSDFYRLPPQNVRLIHTDVEIRPLWSKRTIEGTATLTLCSIGRAVRAFYLDAVQFRLDSVGGSRPLSYAYPADSQGRRARINITLQRPLLPGDTLTLFIRYRKRFSPPSKPRPWERSRSLGMYWVNPLGRFPGKVRSLWTQGETAYNCEWMPTIEHPRQKSTFTFQLTVDTSLLTIANGVMAYQYDNGDGTRTDVWKMARPMSPYLAFIGIGAWSMVKVPHGRLPLYWVAPPGHEEAGRIQMARTARMIEAFSRRFDEPFPWPKYGQVVVRDFVAGGMENASITALYEGMAQRPIQARNREGEGLIAHELAHQWWGDLVTLTSWPHLFINESWAEFSEYLWHELDGDSVRAAAVLYSWVPRVLRASRRSPQPIVNYHQADPEDLFDAHRYPRGAYQLYGLRWYLGDTLFWKAMGRLLDERKWDNASLHDFISVLERTTGHDLEWLVYQLFLDEAVAGYRVSYHAADTPYLQIVTTSEALHLPIPITVRYPDRTVTDTFRTESGQDTMIYSFAGPIEWYVFNSGRPWLMDLRETLPPEMAVRRFVEHTNYYDRYFLSKTLPSRLDTLPLVLQVARAIPAMRPAMQALSLHVINEATDSLTSDVGFLLPVARRLYGMSTPDQAYPSAFRFLMRYCAEVPDAPEAACRLASPEGLKKVFTTHPVLHFRQMALSRLAEHHPQMALKLALADSVLHPFSKLRLVMEDSAGATLPWWHRILMSRHTTYHVALYGAFTRHLARMASHDSAMVATRAPWLNELVYLYLTEVPTHPSQYKSVRRATGRIRHLLNPAGPHYSEIITHLGPETER